MERLIVCGWDEADEGMLAALRAHAGMVPVAIGDGRPTRLVRARAATQLPCYQHLREMLRSTDYDAVLIGASELAADLALDAAMRGARLLVLADRMDADTLEAIATAAVRHGAPLTLLRPALRSAGYAFFADLTEAETRWTPAVLDIELRDARPTYALMRDALAAATRLMLNAPSEVIASAAGPDADEPLALSAQLRYADGSLVTLSTRGGSAERRRLSAQADAGAVEIDSSGDEEHMTLAPWHGEPEHSVFRNSDLLRLEAERIAHAGTADLRFAHREAAVLRALEAALETGAAHPVESCGPRATLRVLNGNLAVAASPRVGQLHVVEA